MGATEQNRWLDETWGDLRVQFLTDCAHGQHTFTVRRYVQRVRDGGTGWEHDTAVENMVTHPTTSPGVHYRAALEDAVYDGEYGEPAALVEDAIAAAPGWPCAEEE